MPDQKMQAVIDAFVAKSHALTGKTLREREAWNTIATAQAIRHFAYGISDDNPLWLDADHAGKSIYGCLQAPPAFLTSVLYPILHGAPMPVPMSNLIGELEYRWFEPIQQGDELHGEAKQTGVHESVDRHGRRLVCIAAEVTYWNRNGASVGKANSTLIWRERIPEERIPERSIYRYSEAELAQIEAALQAESRTGEQALFGEDVELGQTLPGIVRGPFTVGDLVCWQAAIGPSYRPGRLAYQDGLRSPHTMVTNPATGWSVKSSQQHEDLILSKQRGMPLPFDNSVMRFAWLSPLITNWMGDAGKLRRLAVRCGEPVLYGDTTWYRAFVTAKNKVEDGILVTIKISGTNQLGVVTTEGEAEVLLPSRLTKGRQTDGGPVALPRDIVFTYPTAPTVVETIEQRVTETPEAIAVIGGRQCLSYRELNERSNRLARYLRSLGLQADQVVGICLERSPDFIVAVLGVLKAGSVYLPLDADYPAERLAFMLQDARVFYVLTRKFLWPSRIEEPVELFDFAELEQLSAAESTENLPAVASANDLAYVVYTSGSTGQPKAVVPSHFSLSSYIDALDRVLPLGPQDRYLHTASFAFSAAVRQIFFPLAKGATLVIADNEQRHDPRVLFDWMRRQNVTVWDTVPTFWGFCIDALALLEPEVRRQSFDNALRLILVTGEPLNWEIPYRWRYELGQRNELVNLYSQSETTGTVSYYEIPHDVPTRTGIVPIGRPLDNVQILLLDEQNRQVAEHETGQIGVVAKRLPRAYLDRPRLSAEKFIPNPYSAQISPYLYKTGDLARYTDSGVLEFVGRADRRIKIRGFRVELEEIEARLQQHTRIREVAVVEHLRTDGDRQIVAFIVPHAGERPSTQTLRAFVTEKLPDYMVPAAFIVLEQLPRSANGKIDRRALPAPNLSRLGLENAYVAPQDELQRQLAAIWETVLEVSPVGMQDNFFELGGHSLKAMQLFVKIEARFGHALSPSLLLELSTVEQLAEFLRRDEETGSGSSLIAIKSGGALPPLFCVHGIGGNILSYRILAKYLPAERPVYGLQARGLHGVPVYPTSIEEMAAAYLAEIRCVQAQGPYFLAAHSFGGKVIFEMAQQLRRQGQQVGLLALIDSSAPVEPGGGQTPEQRRQGKEAFVNALPAWAREPKIRPLVEVLYEANHQYQAQTYPGKIVFFAARERGKRATDRFIKRWRELAGGGLECHDVDGNHWTMLESPQVQGLAERLARCLTT